MYLWLCILCVALVCLCVLMLAYERRVMKAFQGLPWFPRLPLIGNLHLIIGDGRVLFKVAKQAADICELENSSCVFWFGPIPILLTQDMDDIKTITNALIEKPHFYNFGRIWLGDGLVTAPGIVWKQNIKKLSGTFTASVVYEYLSVFNTQSQKLVDRLKGEVGKKPFDISNKYLAYTTLEAICQTALGFQPVSGSLVTEEYHEAFNTSLHLIISRGMNPLLHPEFIYRLTPSYKKMKKCIAVIHDVSNRIMEKIKNERIQPNTVTQNAQNDNGTKKLQFRSYLDILLEMRDADPSFTEQQIKSEVDTVIVGGQETVASTLSFMLSSIGCKPEIQNNLYAEMKNIFGDSKRPVQKEDLLEMKYSEAVINETLRMFPPFPGFMRYADRELQLKSCKIPKGTVCAVSIFGAGRSKRVWGPDAHQYRPERWLEIDRSGSGPGLLAFSYGRRACIGKKYAMIIMKTILAHLIREFEFVSEAELKEFKIDIAMRPISPNLVTVKLRDHS